MNKFWAKGKGVLHMLKMLNINNFSCTYLHVTVGVTPKAIIKHNTALNVGIPEMQKRKIKIKLLIQNNHM